MPLRPLAPRTRGHEPHRPPADGKGVTPVRFTRRLRCPYIVTDRKRAAAARSQRRQRDVLPLLAPLIAEAQPGIDEVMASRAVHWTEWEQRDRDRRAA